MVYFYRISSQCRQVIESFAADFE